MSTEKGNTKRKRAQKHQNVTAFKNDKYDCSQKTKAINNMEIDNLCQRCREVIEWKIKYKKYKPLTVPRKCVSCGGKTVKAAYHVICDPCAIRLQECAKCQKKEEGVAEKKKDLRKEQVEFEREMKALPERKRRAVMRYIQEKQSTKTGKKNADGKPENKKGASEALDYSDMDEELLKWATETMEGLKLSDDDELDTDDGQETDDDDGKGTDDDDDHEWEDLSDDESVAADGEQSDNSNAEVDASDLEIACSFLKGFWGSQGGNGNAELFFNFLGNARDEEELDGRIRFFSNLGELSKKYSRDEAELQQHDIDSLLEDFVDSAELDEEKVNRLEFLRHLVGPDPDTETSKEDQVHWLNHKLILEHIRKQVEFKSCIRELVEDQRSPESEEEEILYMFLKGSSNVDEFNKRLGFLYESFSMGAGLDEEEREKFNEYCRSFVNSTENERNRRERLGFLLTVMRSEAPEPETEGNDGDQSSEQAESVKESALSYLWKCFKSLKKNESKNKEVDENKVGGLRVSPEDKLQEGNTVAVTEEGNTVAVTEEGNTVAVTEEGNTVAVTEEGNTVAVAEEGNTVAVTEEGNGEGGQ